MIEFMKRLLGLVDESRAERRRRYREGTSGVQRKRMRAFEEWLGGDRKKNFEWVARK